MKGAQDPEVVFILLSFKRPWNMKRLLEPIRSLNLRKRILISNNNAEIDLRPYLPPGANDLELVQQTRNCLAVKRFELARDISAKCFVCLDDDIFLTRAQLRLLLRSYSRDPSVPQGIWGQVLQRRDGVDVLKGGFRNVRREVDVLNRVYAFSDLHIQRYFELLERLGFKSSEDVKHADDVVLSFCGNRAPLIHDLGSYKSCHSDSMPGVALWKENGFAEHRLKVFRRLVALTGRIPCA